MQDKPKFSGFILTGGKSSRMGTNKALLEFKGEKLIERAICFLKNSCSQVYLSGSFEEYKEFGVKIIEDEISGCGPVSGIYSSLKKSNTEWNFMLSVDIPFVNEAIITFLMLNIGDYDCIIPKHEKGIEPLVAFYNKKIVTKLEAEIANSNFKLINILSGLKTNYIDCNELLKKHPNLFVNLNYPEDLVELNKL